jgi:hypothetical protein
MGGIPQRSNRNQHYGADLSALKITSGLREFLIGLQKKLAAQHAQKLVSIQMSLGISTYFETISEVFFNWELATTQKAGSRHI